MAEYVALSVDVVTVPPAPPAESAAALQAWPAPPLPPPHVIVHSVAPELLLSCAIEFSPSLPAVNPEPPRPPAPPLPIDINK